MFLCILHTCGSLRYIDPPNYDNSVGLTGASYRQAATASSCLLSLNQSLADASSFGSRSQSTIENVLARFELWASNLGIFEKGRGSIDQRLREAPEVQSLLLGILRMLHDTAVNLSHTIQHFNSRKFHTADDYEFLVKGDLEPAVQSISEELVLLNDVANRVRKASRKSNDLKAATSFRIRDNDGNDAESFLKELFTSNLIDRFPDLSDTLKERLSSTMVLRRRRVLYRRSRYGQNPIRVAVELDHPELLPPPAKDSHLRSSVSRSSEHSGILRQPDAAALSSLQPSTRTATTLKAGEFRKTAEPSIISQSKSIPMCRHEPLTFPSPPLHYTKRRFKKLKAQRTAEFQDELFSLDYYALYHEHNGSPPLESALIEKLQYQIDSMERTLRTDLETLWEECLNLATEVVCPYCFYVLSSLDVANDKIWRDHILSDLEPYICLFHDCDQAEEMYRHSREWLHHMRRHTLRWRCPARSHGVMFFDKQTEYVNHVKSVHRGATSDTQLVVLAERNLQSTGPIFTTCPFCGAGENDPSVGHLEDHVVGHLRSLALKSLPPYYDCEAGSDSDSTEDTDMQSVSFRSGRSTIENDPESGEPLTFDDYLIIDEGETQGSRPSSLNRLPYYHETILREYLENHKSVTEVREILRSLHSVDLTLSETEDYIQTHGIRKTLKLEEERRLCGKETMDFIRTADPPLGDDLSVLGSSGEAANLLGQHETQQLTSTGASGILVDTNESIPEVDDEIRIPESSSANNPVSPNNESLFASVLSHNKFEDAGQSGSRGYHPCSECRDVVFKEEDDLNEHFKAQHRQYPKCVFHFAGCVQTFRSMKDYMRHCMSKHKVIHYWLCQQGQCAEVPNGTIISNGTLFDRKDRYTQHLRCFHIPEHIRENVHAQELIQGCEDQNQQLQVEDCKIRTEHQTHIECPLFDCNAQFGGSDAWEEQREHFEKHIDGVKDGSEAYIRGDDKTLINWAGRPDVSVIRQYDVGQWKLIDLSRPTAAIKKDTMLRVKM